ncbi:hypothetical protein F5Y16DRAFT_42153 [Xylariaceae sp. FL0255]|nr:hypothetical protein F5Y16DRAFT_42153 [Xylariaceae sp. FL0255]
MARYAHNVFVGKILHEQFRIEKFLRKENHCAVFSVSPYDAENNTTDTEGDSCELEAHVFDLHSLLPKHKHYRLRSIKRLAARTVLHVRNLRLKAGVITLPLPELEIIIYQVDPAASKAPRQLAHFDLDRHLPVVDIASHSCTPPDENGFQARVRAFIEQVSTNNTTQMAHYDAESQSKVPEFKIQQLKVSVEQTPPLLFFALFHLVCRSTGPYGENYACMHVVVIQITTFAQAESKALSSGASECIIKLSRARCVPRHGRWFFQVVPCRVLQTSTEVGDLFRKFLVLQGGITSPKLLTLKSRAGSCDDYFAVQAQHLGSLFELSALIPDALARELEAMWYDCEAQSSQVSEVEDEALFLRAMVYPYTIPYHDCAIIEDST